MYSLILMTAMAGTPDVSSFGWRSAGCTGCTGVAVGCAGSSYTYSSYSCSGCYGSSCSGVAYSCSGCHGGPAFPVLGAVARGTARVVTAPFRLIGNLASCHGCTGYSCSGCYGSSCYGASCFGSSCFGSSCYGSCYGSGCSGISYGSCYGSGCSGLSFGGCTGLGYTSVDMIGGGSGCIGSTPTIIHGSAPVVGEHFGTISLDNSTVVSQKPTVIVEKASDKASANLTIVLPTKAKLYVDGNLISGDGEKRAFHTPELAKGQTYYYDVKAVVEVDGKMESEEKRVVVKAGDSLNEEFPKLIAAVKNANPSSVATR
ncbi:MAG: TIGR03000 domain-containing protein [Fimbriiglobus sp.]